MILTVFFFLGTEPKIGFLISDQIIKKSSMVYASSLYRVYKRKGGYTQALKDFNSLVPTPTGTNGVRTYHYHNMPMQYTAKINVVIFN